MKTQKNDTTSNKLRQQLTKLFKNGNAKVNQVIGNAQKKKLKTEPLTTNLEKPKSNIKVPTEEMTKNNRKRKLQRTEATKTENKSSSIPKKENKNVKSIGKGNLQEGKMDSKSDSKDTKTFKSTEKAKVVKKKPKIDLTLVQHSGSNNVGTSGSEDTEDTEDYYDSDEDYSFNDGYENCDQYDSYTDDNSDSDDAEEYFDDYNYEYSNSECTESDNEYQYDSDPDYELPRNVPEDLVIHRGECQYFVSIYLLFNF